jgi:3-phosphoshikimate 1-carboxyvinyltransferase
VVQTTFVVQVPRFGASQPHSMTQIILPARKAVDARVVVPGDKSISHRALMLGSIAAGSMEIQNLNRGADVAATMTALRDLGVAIVPTASDGVRVTGANRFADPPGPIDCGNSGSTMRMLAGLVAGRADVILDGDASLRRRPMERVAAPLRMLGAAVETSAGRPPLVLHRSERVLRGGLIELEHASAQVKSALLFAALRADAETIVVEPLPTRDHSERLLRAMGASIEIDGRSVRIRPSALAALASYRVPGDFSAAFYFIAAAAAIPGTHLIICDVGVNPSRTASLDVVRAMGADVQLLNERTTCCEPLADVEVRGGRPLTGFEIAADMVPNLIDEIPALCALACLAEGNSSVRGASELRVKESDRIATTAGLLRSFGASVEELPDGIVVNGRQLLRAPASINTLGDHRIGLTAAVLAAATGTQICIEDADCIATSFPGFEDVWRAAFAGP